mmetsp:Transcript_29023/g.84095  ORF Transcript_29023/g.84095 Transcript_29023/m.84095 type:complete len:259 (-) Transcript_29023:194-970(-)
MLHEAQLRRGSLRRRQCGGVLVARSGNEMALLVEDVGALLGTDFKRRGGQCRVHVAQRRGRLALRRLRRRLHTGDPLEGRVAAAGVPAARLERGTAAGGGDAGAHGSRRQGEAHARRRLGPKQRLVRLEEVLVCRQHRGHPTLRHPKPEHAGRLRGFPPVLGGARGYRHSVAVLARLGRDVGPGGDARLRLRRRGGVRGQGRECHPRPGRERGARGPERADLRVHLGRGPLLGLGARARVCLRRAVPQPHRRGEALGA